MSALKEELSVPFLAVTYLLEQAARREHNANTRKALRTASQIFYAVAMGTEDDFAKELQK